MKTFKQYLEEVKKPTGDLKKACWDGYTAVGTKQKGGRTVPNCVPEEVEQIDESVKIVDRDSDLDQEHFKLHVNGKPEHFVHHNYENGHATDSKEDIHYQVKHQLKHLSPEHQKAVTNAVHASYRIKEEVKQVDEGLKTIYHKIMAKRAGSKADDAADMDDEKEFRKQVDKSEYHRVKAGGKPTRINKNPDSKMLTTREEVEQIDELSKNTLRKYVNKARSDRMDALHSNYRNTDDDYEAAKKDNERVEKRDRGINLARAKINKFGKSGNTIAKVKATEEVELDETAAWQRKEGKRESGGLNQKGVESYRREHPGSKLKTAVTTKPSKLKAGSKAANRRKSFCARMSGMKKRLTSAKTARDPDSRINKSLRKWNC